jgi:uncharacterized protein (TIRG00374 family)
LTKSALVLLKLVISIAILWFIFTKIDLTSARLFLGSARGLMALGVLVLLVLVQHAVAAFRGSIIAKTYGYSLSFWRNFNICLMGTFFSQAMISFVGGDAIKIWSLSNSNITLSKATSIVFLDRMIGLLVLLLMLVSTLPSLIKLGSSVIFFKFLLGIAVIGLLLLIIAVIWRDKLFPRLQQHRLFAFVFEALQAARSLWRNPKHLVLVTLSSVLVHLMYVLSIWAAASLYDVNISIPASYIIGVPALVMSMLPISVAGWGVRETALMLGFMLLGLPQDKGVAASVLWGLALILASFPGMIMFLLEKRQRQLQAAAPISSVA